MSTDLGGSLERAHTWAIRIALFLVLSLTFAACADSGGGKSTGSAPDKPAEATVGEPLAGTVKGGKSYYVTFSTDSAGDYEIALTGGSLSWTLYDDPDYTALRGAPRQATVTDCPGGSCTTDSLDSNTDYYLQIANLGEDKVTFTLTLETGMGVGSVNEPVAISAPDQTYHAAQVGTGFSYYVFNLGQSDAWWCIIATNSDSSTLSALDDEVDLYLYSDAAFETERDSAEFASDTTPEVCNGGVDMPDTLYVKVDGTKTSAGESFYLYNYID